MSRLSAEFPFGNLGFGAHYSMEILGSLIRGLQSNGGGPGHQQPSAERKVPQSYDPKWTHPHPVEPGFTHDIIEPPVEIDTYFDDKAVVTGPLPDTTPICAGCRHALVTGASGDQRIWALPCGHVIDGRCIDRLSGLTPASSLEEMEGSGYSQGKGKAKAIDPLEDEPPAKQSRTSARNRPTKPPTPKRPTKPKRFDCPVEGCDQKCAKEPNGNGKYAAWEVFV